MEEEPKTEELMEKEAIEGKSGGGTGEQKPRRGKRWRLPALLAILLLAIGGIVAGVGFIDVDKIETYDCGNYEYYDCGYWEDVDCSYYTGVDCGYYEYYNCGYTLYYPCETVELVPVSYTEWDDGWNVESWLTGCDVDVWTNIRNTDSQGGIFNVQFRCYYTGQWNSLYRSGYIAPGNTQRFEVEFGKSCDVSCTLCETIITPPTKPVEVTDWCTTWIDQTCQRWVDRTCSELVQQTCTRWVDKTCTRWMDKSCWTFSTTGFFPKHLPDSFLSSVQLGSLTDVPSQVQGVYYNNAGVWKFWAPGVPGTTLTTLGGGHTYDYMVAVTGDCEWEIPLP